MRTVRAARQGHGTGEQDGVARVRLALPPKAAERLSQLVPPRIAEEVRRSGVDIDELERKISAGDLAPRMLIDYTSEQGKHVRIWLE